MKKKKSNKKKDSMDVLYDHPFTRKTMIEGVSAMRPSIGRNNHPLSEKQYYLGSVGHAVTHVLICCK